MSSPPTFDDLVPLLSQGIALRAAYFEAHPRVQEPAMRFVSRLDELLRGSGRAYFFLGLVEGNLVHEGRFLIGATILGQRVTAFLEALDSGGILFRAGLELPELLTLFEIATQLRKEPLDLAGAVAALTQRGVRHIQLSPAYRHPGWFGQFLYEGEETRVATVGAGDPMERLVPVYQSMFHAVDTAHRQAGRHAELDVDGVRGVSEQLIQSAGGSFTDLMQLVRYPDYDTFTVGHSVRVASIAVLVGHGIGLPRELQIELATAGMLHDVGKSKVPEEILFKPTALDEDERRVIDQHPILGAQILIENRQAGPMAIAAAWGHHLRYDGGGYATMPNWGARSRITALLKVCDVFEALTASRPYKSAMSARSAYEIMLQDRGCFDPGALRALIAALGLYPPGTHVRLSSGERGVVTQAGPRIELPVVRVTHDRTDSPVQPVQLDLSAHAGSVRVTGVLADEGVQRRAPRAAGLPPGMCSHAQHDAEHAAFARFLGGTP